MYQGSPKGLCYAYEAGIPESIVIFFKINVPTVMGWAGLPAHIQSPLTDTAETQVASIKEPHFMLLQSYRKYYKTDRNSNKQ